MPIASLIRTIPNHPKQGILFRDITTLLKDAVGLRAAVDEFVNRYNGMNIQKVAGIESRGFILGAPIAYMLGVGFVPIRKKGKLPSKTIAQEYALEYGTDVIEVHTDAIAKANGCFWWTTSLPRVGRLRPPSSCCLLYRLRWWSVVLLLIFPS